MAEQFRVIDSDTHVDETDGTWDFIAPEWAAYKPTTQFPANPDPNRPPVRYWLVDGKRKHRRIRDDGKSGTPLEARELLDVETRLRHMDELGTQTQVIYPSLFLVEPADSAETELAITRSYNRWLADRCAQSHGRLRWVCVPPARNIEAALEELRFAKDNGACGVLKKGDLEADKWSVDPYFFPLYEEAERLDMPICFHLGSGAPDHTPARELSYGSFIKLRMPAIHGIYSLILHRVPERFPKLRFGCIESGVSWVPFVDYDPAAQARPQPGLEHRLRFGVRTAGRHLQGQPHLRHGSDRRRPALRVALHQRGQPPSGLRLHASGSVEGAGVPETPPAARGRRRHPAVHRRQDPVRQPQGVLRTVGENDDHQRPARARSRSLSRSPTGTLLRGTRWNCRTATPARATSFLPGPSARAA